MPRARFIASADFPYHISARSNNKEWFSIPTQDVWDIFSEHLNHVVKEYSLRIHAFVLMNNHFHLLAATPDANLNIIMNYLMREVSKSINKQASKINHVFGRPHSRTLIDNPAYYDCAYKYVYRNPVEANICKMVEDYKFSTIRGILGLENQSIIAIDNACLIQNPIKIIRWLNSPFPSTEIKAGIKLALSKQFFEVPKRREDGKPAFDINKLRP